MLKIQKHCLPLAYTLLVGSLLTACATGPVLPQPADPSVCQIIYSPIPHVTSGHIIGQDNLDSIFRLKSDDKRRFFRSLADITEGLVTATIDPTGSWERQPVEEVVGGYEGKTSPSLNLRFLSRQGGEISQLEQVADAIGYVYAQDSVLVQCSDDGIRNDTDAVTVVVKNGTSRPFLDSDGAPILFGIMIALNNGPENLGYTYYPESGRFETLEKNVEARKTEKILEAASQQLMRISDGEVSLDISVEALEVSFPHNSWSTARQGESYLSRLPIEVDRQILAEHRQRFLDTIDVFLDASTTE